MPSNQPPNVRRDPGSKPYHAELSRVIARFPERALGIREHFLRDARFRTVCKEYCLACDSLARFEALTDARHKQVIAEYRNLIGELETELTEQLPGSAQGSTTGQK